MEQDTYGGGTPKTDQSRDLHRVSLRGQVQSEELLNNRSGKPPRYLYDIALWGQ